MFLVFVCPLYTCFPVSQCFSSFLKAQSLWAIFLHRALCIGIDLLFLGRECEAAVITGGASQLQELSCCSCLVTLWLLQKLAASSQLLHAEGAELHPVSGTSSLPSASACSQHNHTLCAAEPSCYTSRRTELRLPDLVF